MTRLATGDLTPPKQATRYYRLRATGKVSRGHRKIARDREAVEPRLRDRIGQLLSGRLPWPFYLCGPAGRGKTCAALCLVDAVPWAVFTTAEQWADALYQRDHILWRRAREAPLVAIDEIAKREDTHGRERSALCRLADIRQYRPTVWISNHPPERLLQLFDDRVHSRLCCGTKYWLGGVDRRQVNHS